MKTSFLWPDRPSSITQPHQPPRPKTQTQHSKTGNVLDYGQLSTTDGKTNVMGGKYFHWHRNDSRKKKGTQNQKERQEKGKP